MANHDSNIFTVKVEEGTREEPIRVEDAPQGSVGDFDWDRTEVWVDVTLLGDTLVHIPGMLLKPKKFGQAHWIDFNFDHLIQTLNDEMDGGTPFDKHLHKFVYVDGGESFDFSKEGGYKVMLHRFVQGQGKRGKILRLRVHARYLPSAAKLAAEQPHTAQEKEKRVGHGSIDDIEMNDALSRRNAQVDTEIHVHLGAIPDVAKRTTVENLNHDNPRNNANQIIEEGPNPPQQPIPESNTQQAHTPSDHSKTTSTERARSPTHNKKCSTLPSTLRFTTTHLTRPARSSFARSSSPAIAAHTLVPSRPSARPNIDAGSVACRISLNKLTAWMSTMT
ncbi:hypothetical protein PMZ80_007353 [Knufia obscura]|uniref:Uncharacterized protein n=2 Tax=Knufia TaxID=430999 RepID=A0AAN8EC12_9EURO|nr:hypothetical protein PMZ80_007353 [Knufia obscura]KAK5950560.1 hypothetical protein OHC33_008503 [Knufia fluminis]